jgi:hypothetical protein
VSCEKVVPVFQLSPPLPAFHFTFSPLPSFLTFDSAQHPIRSLPTLLNLRVLKSMLNWVATKPGKCQLRRTERGVVGGILAPHSSPRVLAQIVSSMIIVIKRTQPEEQSPRPTCSSNARLPSSFPSSHCRTAPSSTVHLAFEILGGIFPFSDACFDWSEVCCCADHQDHPKRYVNGLFVLVWA